METELIKELNGVLKTFPQFWDGEKLHRSMVIDAINQKDPILIKALISNDKIKLIYSTSIDGIILFDFEKLTSLLKYKELWNDSFTKYRNAVGLTSEGKYLNYNSDVILDFPFKDCVLEGGMTKEDQGKDEIYYNEVIARDEIDRLFAPKVLTKAKRYTKDGIEENITDFSDEDNLIIKGNNLIALHSLKERYAGKVKLIYIDPPYNTGNDSFKYNDRFNRSTWLTFMKNRLEIARELLRDDGVIFIQSDDSEQAYLKVLMDSIFQEENYVNTISINLKNIAGASGGGEDKRLKKNIEYITLYAKNYLLLPSFNNVYEYTPIHELVDRYKEEGISWKYTSILIDAGDKQYIGSTLDGSGDEIRIYKRLNPIFKSINQVIKDEQITEKEAYQKYGNQIFQTAMPQSSIRPRIMEKCKELGVKCDFISIEYVPKSGRNKGNIYEQFYRGDNFRLLAWLSDVSTTIDGELFKKDALGTYWDFVKYTKNLTKEGGVSLLNGKKPEALLSHIITMATSETDIVLDFHLGSGTTAAVAHKMGRRYIGIEQMDYINEITVPRLQKVIEGEQGGISKDVEWQGGGSFVYVELMELNYRFIHEIEKAQDYEALTSILEEMKVNAHLNYHADLNKVLKTAYEMDGMPRLVSFDELELHEQKKLLIELLDKNQLYVSLSEINDKTLHVSDEDKAFNRSFYKKD